MKKMRKCISITLAVIVLTVFTPVAFAGQTKLPEAQASLAVIQSITERDNYRSILIQTLSEPKQEIVLNISDESIFLDNVTGKTLDFSQLKENENIWAYYSSAMTMSIPPQSHCIAIVTNVDKQISLAKLVRIGEILESDEGTLRFLNTDEDYVITIPKDISITKLETGEDIALADLKTGDLMFAWLGVVALSHPAQAQAQSVVFVPESPKDISIDLSQAGAFTRNGNTMVPLRMVFESLGFHIGWNETEKKVTLNDGAMQLSVVIGQDSYMAGDLSEPVHYNAAPVLLNGSTYVPIQYVDLVLGIPGCTKLEDGILTIDR